MVKLISESNRKNDEVDAELLARLVRADRLLLSPLKHRGEEAQADLMAVRFDSDPDGNWVRSGRRAPGNR